MLVGNLYIYSTFKLRIGSNIFLERYYHIPTERVGARAVAIKLGMYIITG